MVRGLQEEHLGQVRPVHTPVQGSGDMHEGTKEAEGNLEFPLLGVGVFIMKSHSSPVCDREHQPAWARSSDIWVPAPDTLK